MTEASTCCPNLAADARALAMPEASTCCSNLAADARALAMPEASTCCSNLAADARALAMPEASTRPRTFVSVLCSYARCRWAREQYRGRGPRSWGLANSWPHHSHVIGLLVTVTSLLGGANPHSPRRGGRRDAA